MSENTRIVIGCSKDDNYAFLVPLSALFWRHVVGYEPLVLLVGYPEEWLEPTKLRVVYDALASSIDFDLIRRADGYPDHSTAQNCRQHAGALDWIQDDTWVMPADADLWPLKRDFYHQHEGTPYRCIAYYANGDHFQGRDVTLERSSRGLGTQTLPTCHVAMRAKDWREIYQPIPRDVAGSIKKTLDAWMPTRVEVPGYDKGFHLWMTDQQIMTVALCKQPWFPDAVKFVERAGHPPIDRLDRSHPRDWDKFDASRWTDAHVHKNPSQIDHWLDLLQIIDAVIPQHSAWAREYWKAYTGVGK